MNTPETVVVGRVGKSHGLDGSFVVENASEAPERFEVGAELLEYLAKQLVDDPDSVRVERIDEEDAVVLRLHVAQDDVGKVIGRQGRIARALRTIVRAGSVRERRRVQLEIVD